MALYIPHSIFHLARRLYVSPETFGPYYVCCVIENTSRSVTLRNMLTSLRFFDENLALNSKILKNMQLLSAFPHHNLT